jgi:hypothetical protein
MGSQRTKHTKAESLQFSMMNSHAREDTTPETMDKTEAKPVLDLSKFKKD